MTGRRRLYVVSAVAAGGLLVELGWFLDDRLGLHLVDRTVRLAGRLRDAARI